MNVIYKTIGVAFIIIGIFEIFLFLMNLIGSGVYTGNGFSLIFITSGTGILNKKNYGKNFGLALCGIGLAYTLIPGIFLIWAYLDNTLIKPVTFVDLWAIIVIAILSLTVGCVLIGNNWVKYCIQHNSTQDVDSVDR